MQESEEIIIHRRGNIRKLDGVLRANSPAQAAITGDGQDGLVIHFLDEKGALMPFKARVLASGDEGEVIRDGVMRSLNFHLNNSGDT